MEVSWLGPQFLRSSMSLPDFRSAPVYPEETSQWLVLLAQRGLGERRGGGGGVGRR